MTEGRKTIRRGEIWLVNFDPKVGEEINEQRPALVINEDSIGILDLRIVVPITSWRKKYEKIPWVVHLPISKQNRLKNESGADAFQVKSVSLDRFVHKIGNVGASVIEEIVAAVALCIGYV